MTQYMLTVHHDDTPVYASDEEMRAAMAATGAFNERLMEAGEFVFAGGLEKASTARVVDGRGAEPLVTDGPYLEAREHIGGFWVLELPDMETALARAAEGSAACLGTVEVRPFQGV